MPYVGVKVCQIRHLLVCESDCGISFSLPYEDANAAQELSAPQILPMLSRTLVWRPVSCRIMQSLCCLQASMAIADTRILCAHDQTYMAERLQNSQQDPEVEQLDGRICI